MKALIFGVGGQDGAYLSKLLLSKGYSIFGTSRDLKLSHFPNLIKLDIKDKIKISTLDIRDYKSVLKYIDMIKPDEIYNLSGQTSVSLSFKQPFEAMESIAKATMNILEAIRVLNTNIRFYNAGSSECFGDTGNNYATELTPFNPSSPYGIAKATAHYLVKNYREAYSLYASTGFLFNHESPLRPQHFVTQKIISTAARINAGYKERLKLGNLSISRDWGWAPDYVEAIWRILKQSSPGDFIIATGKTTSLQQFVEKSFSFFNLNWEDYVDIDTNLMRPSDIQINCGNVNKSKKMLGWTSTKNIDEIISALCTSAKGIYK
jgi:GDPmannose 4,6-dehydratase